MKGTVALDLSSDGIVDDVRQAGLQRLVGKASMVMDWAPATCWLVGPRE